MSTLTFIGTGEAFDPALPNTSLLYRGSASVLLDCGYSVPPSLWRTLVDPEALDAVYLTHRHADHCFGLPALVVWMRIAGRRRPLHLLGGPGAREHIPALLELGYEGAYDPRKCFPLLIDEIAPGRAFALGALSLTTAPSTHTIPNHAVRIDDGDDAIAYSGDGAASAATTALFRGASCLVHECFGPAPAIRGHAAFEDVVRSATEAAVRDLFLVHLSRDPDLRARVVALAATHAGPPHVHVPAPGAVVEFG